MNLDMIPVDDIVSIGEMSQMFHLDGSTVSNWAARRGTLYETYFPPPRRKLIRGELFDKWEVAAWYLMRKPRNRRPQPGNMDPNLRTEVLNQIRAGKWDNKPWFQALRETWSDEQWNKLMEENTNG